MIYSIAFIILGHLLG